MYMETWCTASCKNGEVNNLQNTLAYCINRYNSTMRTLVHDPGYNYIYVITCIETYKVTRVNYIPRSWSLHTLAPTCNQKLRLNDILLKLLKIQTSFCNSLVWGWKQVYIFRNATTFTQIHFPWPLLYYAASWLRVQLKISLVISSST